VFHPDEKFKTEQGFVAEVPLVLYCWKEDDTWYLKNITNPGKPYHVSADAEPGQAGPPRALFQELDDPDRLPAGVVHYDLPGGLAGEVRTTDGLTWAKFFAYLGLGPGLAWPGSGSRSRPSEPAPSRWRGPGRWLPPRSPAASARGSTWRTRRSTATSTRPRRRSTSPRSSRASLAPPRSHRAASP
jgi:hypothetical protein